MMDMPAPKVADLLQYEQSPHFSPRERTVVALALAAAQVPNAAEAKHFVALREHFTDRQIVQLVAMIGLFGFLNRWNDTLATTLESTPMNFAQAALEGLAWTPGKHTG